MPTKEEKQLGETLASGLGDLTQCINKSSELLKQGYLEEGLENLGMAYRYLEGFFNSLNEEEGDGELELGELVEDFIGAVSLGAFLIDTSN